MGKITVDDVVARCLMKQSLIIAEGDASSIKRTLFTGTVFEYYSTWNKTFCKMAVHCIMPMESILYIYCD
jgi:hypothetical protein